VQRAGQNQIKNQKAKGKNMVSLRDDDFYRGGKKRLMIPVSLLFGTLTSCYYSGYDI